MNIIYEKELATALRAAKSAGIILRKTYGKPLNEQVKDSWQDTVTSTDLAADKTIKQIISKAFPKHAIFSEESTTQGSEATWYVDPLDGTTNFVTHIPFFCTAIGLAKSNEPVVGAVFDPLANELFYAAKGKGAFLNGKRIHCSNNKEIKKTLINFCHKNIKQDIEKINSVWTELKLLGRDLRRLGSGNLDIGFVAAGRNDAYFSNSKIFDIAPALIIAREAGCKVTDWSGQEWNIDSENIIITNGKVHDSLLDILRKIN